MSPPPEVRAGGGVLWREADGRVLVAVVHRPKYDDWSLPKGKLDPGEPCVVGAVREVTEETGFRAVVGRGLGSSRYRVLDRGRDVPKTVRWWAMRCADGTFVPGAEIDALEWLPVEQAQARVSAGRDDGVLTRFKDAPARTSTVLLVRHGRAGDRDAWDGPDDERPLDDEGLAQAQALAAVLPLWEPAAVLSAPPLRCRATVQPFADRAGLPVEVDDRLAEDAGDALTERLRELGRAGRTVVLCSQGGVIPDAVAALTGLPRSEVPARKGSLWALSFADGRLVDADHTADVRA